jgi:uncharacterized protein YodC (DUF2158 family)
MDLGGKAEGNRFPGHTGDADLDREYAELLRAGEPPKEKPRRARKARQRQRYEPEEPQEYFIGDVVQLRSGGPSMTVWTAEPAVTEGCWPWMYWCHWFDGGGNHRNERFPGHVLRLQETEE